MILSYLEQLEVMAKDRNLVLADAFKAAGVPHSTFWRVTTQRHQLRFDTATKIASILEGGSRNEGRRKRKHRRKPVARSNH
jgi:predicted transcriptional regulator